MTAHAWVVVYNPADEILVVDEDGRTAYPQDFAYARRSIVKDLIDSDKLIVISMNDITDASTPAARMAKQEAQKRNDDIDAEKAESKAELPHKVVPPKADKADKK